MESNAGLQPVSFEGAILKATHIGRRLVRLHNGVLVEESRLVALHELGDLLEEEALEAPPRHDLRVAVVQHSSVAYQMLSFQAARSCSIRISISISEHSESASQFKL